MSNGRMHTPRGSKACTSKRKTNNNFNAKPALFVKQNDSSSAPRSLKAPSLGSQRTKQELPSSTRLRRLSVTHGTYCSIHHSTKRLHAEACLSCLAHRNEPDPGSISLLQHSEHMNLLHGSFPIRLFHRRHGR